MSGPRHAHFLGSKSDEFLYQAGIVDVYKCVVRVSELNKVTSLIYCARWGNHEGTPLEPAYCFFRHIQELQDTAERFTVLEPLVARIVLSGKIEP